MISKVVASEILMRCKLSISKNNLLSDELLYVRMFEVTVALQ